MKYIHNEVEISERKGTSGELASNQRLLLPKAHVVSTAPSEFLAVVLS